MDILKTSLDALLLRATSPENAVIDKAGFDAFIALINKEKDGPHIATKLIAHRIHSSDERVALQALKLLEASMRRCGSSFQGEVGKFRFLNEMIKLVSPKYLGLQTPPSIRDDVLQLLYLWTKDYPKEIKIKEAYDMLKKQGVVKETTQFSFSDNFTAESMVAVIDKRTIFEDEEKSKLLKKLLKSKNPEDLQAANRLIKSMVKEDDKRAEWKSKKLSELESIHNNTKLLNEMLDSYTEDTSSADDLELIKELYDSCLKYRKNTQKFLSELHDHETLYEEVQLIYDQLGLVLDKYASKIKKLGTVLTPAIHVEPGNLSLLKFDDSEPIPVDSNPTSPSSDPFPDILDCRATIITIPDDNILQPVTVLPPSLSEVSDATANKSKAFEDLEALGEHLFRENLQSNVRLGAQFNKPDKIPMNMLSKPAEKQTQVPENTPQIGHALDLDLTFLMNKMKTDNPSSMSVDESSLDDILVDITETQNKEPKEANNGGSKCSDSNKLEILPQSTLLNGKDLNKLKLGDIFVKLEDVRPSNLPPIVALEEKNGISVTLHLAKDKPAEDIIVVVVTMINKKEKDLKNILFRAVVPKTCKVKLQSPSATELPAYNPFLPPSAVTQLMLIANPEKVLVSLKFVVSYNIDDETITEMGEIGELPFVE